MEENMKEARPGTAGPRFLSDVPPPPAVAEVRRQCGAIEAEIALAVRDRDPQALERASARFLAIGTSELPNSDRNELIESQDRLVRMKDIFREERRSSRSFQER